jgi:hypothetical protein
MGYADLSDADLVLLAVEFIGRGHEIPQEVCVRLGAELIADITFPEIPHEPPVY